ncbi:MAG: hypothetical protein ABEI52_07445, partial [Halobacteriaceae archaeon]
TGEQYEASYKQGTWPDATRVGHRDDAIETTLVTVEDDRAVQVLDPETFEAITIPRPSFLDPSADSISVLKSESGLHAIPE